MTYYCSILDRIFTEMRYHPVLENFPEYESLRRAKIPFNQSEKYELPGLMIAGRNHPLLTYQPIYWQRHTLTTSKKTKQKNCCLRHSLAPSLLKMITTLPQLQFRLVAAYDSCRRPCTEVTYSFQAEPFTASTAEERDIARQRSHWSSFYITALSLIESFIVINYFHIDSSPALLCHKDTA